MKKVKLFITCTMIVSYSPAVYSLIFGKLDTLLETDKATSYSRNRIEEQVDLNWLDNKNNMRAGLQLDIRAQELDIHPQTERSTDHQINQLFFSHDAKDTSYTLGRFNRSDLLGYYTLQGISVKHNKKNWSAALHAGKPLHIEDYIVIDADQIYGLDINHQTGHINDSIIQRVNSLIGWQQIKKGKTQNYIHWGITGKSEKQKVVSNNIKNDHVEIFFNGSYLIENNSAESINTGVQRYSKALGMARVAYTSWKPEQVNLSFKEQFYSVYGIGKQSILQADLFYNHRWDQQYYIRGRKVWREAGDNGYGATAGFEQKVKSNKAPGWQTQWDSLVLNGDSIHSLFLGTNKDISATLRAHINAAVQYKSYQHLKNNRLLALEAVAQQMLDSDLFIDFNARYIFNEKLRDEYRIGFRLSYRFDNRVRIQ